MASSQADNIYFRLNLTNNGDVEIPARLEVERDSNILDVANEYYLRIVFASLSSNTVPLFYMEPNSLSITIVGADNIPYQEFLQPNPLFASDPNAFYYIEQFLQSMNDALILANNSSNASNGTTFEPPVIVYDYLQKQMTIVYDYTAYVNNTGPQLQNIYFNSGLFQKIRGFLTGAPYLPNGRDIELKIYENGINRFPAGISANLNYDLLKIQNEEPGYNSLLGIKALVVYSNTMPINQEFVALASQNSSGLAANNMRPIILEIPLSLNLKGEFEDINYVNDFYPILIDLKSNTPLRKVDFQIFMVDNSDRLYPVFVGPKDSISFKYAFIRKSLFKYR